MEDAEEVIQGETEGCTPELLDSKRYELKYKEDIYSLLIERYSDDYIQFELRKSNSISLYHYITKYKFNDIIKRLSLKKEYQQDSSKIFKFFDLALTNKKIHLEYNNYNKNIMELILKKEKDVNKLEGILKLNTKKIENDEMFNILINEINEIKNNKKENKDNIINELIKKNKEYENKIKLLEDKINILENEINQFKESQNKIIKEALKPKEEKHKLMNQIDFKENPQNLKFKYQLTNNRPDSGLLCNFDVFIGLKDKIEYIIYNNKNNYNLDIMRINDQSIITSLTGHNNKTTVIRYYLKNNNEDYILSCDCNKLVIIWDIQNNYNQKYIIQSDYSGYIRDALLLFNYNNKDYILLSSERQNEYSKLYEFKDKTPFVKNIYETNKNKTYYMIPWLYNNKYYIIECCYNKISINNIFEDENYSNLSKEPEGDHCCGYIYNNNYLCVSGCNNNYIRIWDLVNKSIYKQINYDARNGCEIIPWNNKYTIIGCEGCFVIIDIEEGKMIKKINSNKAKDLGGLKKIKMKNLGECLIGSGNGNIIELFSI